MSIVAAITLPGCIGVSPFQAFPKGPGGPIAPPGPTFITTSTADPVGDANTAVGGTPWDITQVATSRPASGATSLTITTMIAQAVSIADLAAPGSGVTSAQLGVVLLFSTGSGGGTATIAKCVGSPTFAHVNYAVNAANMRLADGNFPVVSFNGSSPTQTGEAAISVSGPNAITYTVPISAIGGGSGAIQVEVIGGNANGPTDCAPNSTYIST